MEGINIEIVINNDDKLIVDMVVIEKESGAYHVAASSTPTGVGRTFRREILWTIIQ